MVTPKKSKSKSPRTAAGSTRPTAGKPAAHPSGPQSKKAAAKSPSQKPGKTPKPAPGLAVTPRKSSGPALTATQPSREPDLARALAEAREQIRRLIDDRDNQVALAEAAEMEREALEREVAEARERILSLEKMAERGSAETASAGDAEEGSLGFDEDEEEEEEASSADDLDDVEGIYDRMDDPRVRRQELDRERLDRESEAGDETYWRVCPKCGDSLEEVESEDVKIDRCESCGGIFLDRGEIEMLLSVARGTHGLRRVRSALQI